MIFLTKLFSTFILMYSVSFLIHQFMKLMGFADSETNDVKPVEVVNIGDFSRR